MLIKHVTLTSNTCIFPYYKKRYNNTKFTQLFRLCNTSWSSFFALYKYFAHFQIQQVITIEWVQHKHRAGEQFILHQRCWKQLQQILVGLRRQWSRRKSYSWPVWTEQPRKYLLHALFATGLLVHGYQQIHLSCFAASL